MDNWKEQIEAWHRLRDTSIENGYHTENELEKEEIDFISSTLAAERESVLAELLEKGHGGGNWRRLIEQLREKP